MQNNHRDRLTNEIKSTQITLRVLNILFLVLSALFMFVYLDKHDLIFGLASVLSLGYWSISQLVNIVTSILITVKQVKNDK